LLYDEFGEIEAEDQLFELSITGYWVYCINYRKNGRWSMVNKPRELEQPKN